MTKTTIRRIIRIGFVLVAALFILQLCYYGAINIEKVNNGEKVAKLINEDLKFSWDTMDVIAREMVYWVPDMFVACLLPPIKDKYNAHLHNIKETKYRFNRFYKNKKKCEGEK